MQMELHSNAHIPDGLLASMTLLSEKPRLGVPSRESALHPGIDERNSTAVLGLRFGWSGIVSGTVVAPDNPTARCAAAFGDKYSLASGIKVLGNAVGVNADNAVVNGLFGNDVSAFSNFLSGPNRVSTAVGIAASNPTDYNLAALGVKAVGMLPNPLAAQRIALGFTPNGAAYGAEIITPKIAESILGKVAGGVFAEFTIGKLIYDAATYGAGIVSCRLNGN